MVESKTKIDPKRQTLWGHSYGGLFTLNTLLKHTDMFQRFVAADPSFWWQNGVILQYEKAFTENAKDHDVHLFIMVGKGGERSRNRPNSDSPAVQAVLNARQSVPQGAAKEFAQRLKPFTKSVEYREFEGVSHGPMLSTSIEPALRFSTEKL